MRRKYAYVLAALIVASCGSPSNDTGDSPAATPESVPVSDVSPPTTIASATLPTMYVHVDESLDGPLFDTVEEMLEASELVMSAEVSRVESLGRPDAGEDPNASEYIAVSLQPRQIIEGQPPEDGAVMVWEAWITDESGRRIGDVVLNGLPAPVVGDEMLLFLVPEDRDRRKLYEDVPTHRPVSLTGVAYLRDGVVTTISEENVLAKELSGRTVDEIASG